MRKIPRLPVAGLLSLLAFCSACGGGSGGGSSSSGSLTLQAVWERSATGSGAQFEGGTEIPPSVQTVEVRIVSGGQTFRELVDPEQTRSALITGVPTGDADVMVFGYDVPLLGVPDLRDVAVAPSYASAAVQVLVRAGVTTNAGQIEVLAQPFLTDFSPLPDEADVDPSRDVEFLLAIGVGVIDAGSVDVSVEGATLVSAGVPAANVTFEACADGTATPCGTIDRQLTGFLFRTPPGELPADSSVQVSVNATGGPESSRSLDFSYEFETSGS
jgi:hypothetical protein